MTAYKTDIECLGSSINNTGYVKPTNCQRGVMMIELQNIFYAAIEWENFEVWKNLIFDAPGA